jgi:hypothetical protein
MPRVIGIRLVTKGYIEAQSDVHFDKGVTLVLGIHKSPKKEGLKAMGYTIFEKEYPSKSTSPTITISPLGRCALNRAAAEMLSKDAVDNVLLLWDGEAKKFAIRPITKKDNRSFAIRYTTRAKDDKTVVGAAFSGVMFLKYINYDMSSTGTYPFGRSADGTLYEVQLPAERFGSQQKPLMAVEGGKKHGKAVGGN